MSLNNFAREDQASMAPLKLGGLTGDLGYQHADTYLQFWDAKHIKKALVFSTSRNPMARLGLSWTRENSKRVRM